MSSIALRFVGSAIATMSECPCARRAASCALARLLGDELQDLGVDLVLVEVDRRDAVLLAEEVRDLVVGDVAELGERVAEVLPDFCCSSCACRSCCKQMSFSRTRSSPSRLLFAIADLSLTAGGPVAKDSMSGREPTCRQGAKGDRVGSWAWRPSSRQDLRRPVPRAHARAERRAAQRPCARRGPLRARRQARRGHARAKDARAGGAREHGGHAGDGRATRGARGGRGRARGPRRAHARGGGVRTCAGRRGAGARPGAQRARSTDSATSSTPICARDHDDRARRAAHEEFDLLVASGQRREALDARADLRRRRAARAWRRDAREAGGAEPGASRRSAGAR